MLTFDHARGGLVAKGGPLTGFAVAGADGKFVWAEAKIDGSTVIVFNLQGASPNGRAVCLGRQSPLQFI